MTGSVLLAAAAVTLLWTAVVAAPPEDAVQLCDAGDTALAVFSTRLGADAASAQPRLFRAGYSKADWTGTLRAFDLNADGTVRGAAAWDATAAGRIPAADARLIFTWNGGAIRFKWSDFDATARDLFGAEAMVNYLRGDQRDEISNGGTLRNRSVRLGAIADSAIAFSGAEDYGYAALPAEAGEGYPAYLESKRSRTQLVLVGANDGMLHGFDAVNGAEKFAYVPGALLRETIAGTDPPRSTLTRLAAPGFTPRYYVDGTPWVGDAYWGGRWRTVVVGTAGAGAKSVFALDISAPDAMTAGKVLWDIGGEGDPNLGFAFGEPVIGRLHDGNFYAIFGNGRDSASQCAVLYLVRLDTGAVRRIVTAGACEGNGLGRASLYDAERSGDGYRITDYAYAGDLQGNVWRFDLRSVDLSRDPPTGAVVQLMFAARNGDGEVQPITGTIELGAAPPTITSVPTPVMMWFGTGRHLTFSPADADDRRSTTLQSMYGMVDRFIAGDPDTAKIVRSALQAQTVNTGGEAAGRVTGAAVAYTAAGDGRKDGWYFDLPRAGERMVDAPLLQPGRLIFSTLIPEAGSCVGAGGSWVYAVDPYHGMSLGKRPFVRAAIAEMDFIASSVGVVHSLASIEAGAKDYLYIGGSGVGGAGGGTVQVEELSQAQQPGTRGRVSWREVIR